MLIRVILPAHLRTLAKVTGEVALDVAAPVSQRTILDALETKFPNLRGLVREHGSARRRPLVRFFACEQDLSHESPDAPVPEPVAQGREPFMIVGSMAGG